jgi:quinol monooxygenase YgiN
VYNRITFARLVPGRGAELGEFFEREVAAAQRKVRGNWRELLLEDDEQPGEIRYFSVWHEKKYADAYAANGGFSATARLLRPFFTEDPVTHEYDTYGYFRPMQEQSAERST